MKRSLVVLAVAAGIVASHTPGNAEFAVKWTRAQKLATLTSGAAYQSHGIVDMNGGTPELVTTSGSDVGFQIVDGLTGEILLTRDTGDAIRQVLFADIDGDGLLDAILATNGAVWAVGWQGPPVGAFEPVPSGRDELGWMGQNTPNPFNRVTAIGFGVAGSGVVEVNICDAAGRLVRHLVDSSFNPGDYEVKWDGLDDDGTRLPSGVYFYDMRLNGSTVEARKSIMLK